MPLRKLSRAEVAMSRFDRDNVRRIMLVTRIDMSCGTLSRRPRDQSALKDVAGQMENPSQVILGITCRRQWKRSIRHLG